ncbi:proteasome subunit beta [Candidatus Pacearchaeota archaeon]|nr:proteasome subunit beta [Candidatus Pacearchaeota archaeon]
METLTEEISKNMLKSNTSIVGIVCKDGIVMAGDRRATAGHYIAGKRERKIHRINDYLLVAWTGGVSDAQLTTKVIAAELRLKELKTRSRPSVSEAAYLTGISFYRNIRTPSMVPHIVGTLVAGFNEDGTTELFTIEPAGSVLKVDDFDANFSSGMPYIMGLLENRYNKDVTVKEAISLASDCIKAAIQRDSGSGNGVDVFTITKDGIKHVVSEEIVPQYK